MHHSLKRLVALGIGLVIVGLLSFLVRPKGSNPITPAVTTTQDAVITIPLERVEGDVNVVTRSNSSLTSKEYYAFAPGNFKLIQEVGWSVVPADSVTLAPGLDGVQTALVKDGTKCTLAFMRPSKDYRETHKQFTFGDRVMFSNSQLDGSWYLHKDHLPNMPGGFAFKGTVRLPLPYEVHISHFQILSAGSDHPGSVMIFDQSFKPVSADCFREANAMLTTLEQYFEQTTVDATTQGALFFRSHPSYNAADIDNTQLLLAKDGDPVTREIMKGNFDTPIVYKDRIYFRNKGTLWVLNPFSGAVTEVPGVQPSGAAEVNTFYIYNDILYYLVGNNNCNEYLVKCVQELYRYDLRTSQGMRVAENIAARAIVGYNVANDSLYLYWGEGDAGCFWSTGMEFDFKLGSTTNVTNYGAGEDESYYRYTSQAFHEFLGMSKTQSTTTDYVRIDSGKLLPPEGNLTVPGWRETLRYVY